MNLHEDVKLWPSHWATAPIWRKGAEMPSGFKSTGKAPCDKSRHEVFSPERTADCLEKMPEKYGAAGVWCGERSGGLAILDIDDGYSDLAGKYAKTWKGAPIVKSTNGNAAKILLHVPEKHWDEVEGLGKAAAGNAGFEVLWNGKQGLLGGEYPGKESTGAPAGQYKLVSGSFDHIPEIPNWLLQLMLGAAKPRCPKGLGLSERLSTPVWQRIETVEDCLGVIPIEDFRENWEWVRVGMMIESHLPDQEDGSQPGLELWTKWSMTDEMYESEWSFSDPCRTRWEQGFDSKRANRLDIGSLIQLADQYDPKRTRIKNGSQAKLLKELLEPAQTIIEGHNHLNFHELMPQMLKLQEITSVAEREYEERKLCFKTPFRDDVFELRKLFWAWKAGQNNEEAEDGVQIKAAFKTREYLIPGILPKGDVTLLYGDYGSGKSTTCWALARTIAEGRPFKLEGRSVPVEEGNVLIFNGDQAKSVLSEQLVEGDLDLEKFSHRYHRINGFNINDRTRFEQQVKQWQPKLVIIDSLNGCSKGAEEEKKSFADPLYYFSTQMGEDFPETNIIVLTHENAGGGMRGTKLLGAAVDSTWRCQIPDDETADKLPPSSRLITFQKSRTNDGGQQMVLTIDPNTMETELRGWSRKESKQRPAGLPSRIEQRLVSVYPATWTKHDFAQDALTGGSVAGITKALQRLVAKGMIKVDHESPNPRGGSIKHYIAVMVEEEGGGGSFIAPKNTVQDSPIPSAGKDLGHGHPTSCPQPVQDRPEVMDIRVGSEQCPQPTLSESQGSDRSWTVDTGAIGVPPSPLGESPHQDAFLTSLNKWND